METQQKLVKAAVDYCAKLFPQYTRADLERRILLGEQVHKEKLSTPGVENPLSADELGWYSIFQYYKLWNEATDEERASIPDDVKLEEDEPDPEFEAMVDRLEASGYNIPDDDEDEAPDDFFK